MAISTEDRALLDDPEFQKFVANQLSGGISPAPKQNGLPYEIGKQLVAGAVVDAPKMAAKAGEWFSPAGSDAEQMFHEGKTSWGADEKGWEPQTEGRNGLSKMLVSGARSMAPSVAGMAAAAVNPWVGVPAILGVYGGSQAQESYDKARDAGYGHDEARNIGWKTGAIEGLGETAGDVLGGKFLSGAAKGVGLLAGTAGKEGLGAALKQATSPKWAGTFAKDWLGNAAVQSGTEYGQGYGESAVEKAYGLPTADPHEAGIEGAGAALGMSVLLGPFMGYGHARAGSQRAKLAETLDDPNTPLDTKLAIGKHLHDTVVVPKVGEEHAASWLQSFNEAAVQNVSGRDERTGVPNDAPGAAPTNLLNPEAPTGTQGSLLGEPGGTLGPLMTPGYNDAPADGNPIRDRVVGMMDDRAALDAFVKENYTTSPDMAAQAIALIDRIDNGLRSITQGAPATDTYSDFNPDQGNLNLGFAPGTFTTPTNLLTPETQNAKPISPVVETGGQGSGGNAAAGTGDLGNQPVVGRGSNPSGAPVVSGGANQPVGSGASGANAVVGQTTDHVLTQYGIKKRNKDTRGLTEHVRESVAGGDLTTDEAEGFMQKLAAIWAQPRPVAIKQHEELIKEVLAAQAKNTNAAVGQNTVPDLTAKAVNIHQKAQPTGNEREIVSKIMASLPEKLRSVLGMYYTDKMTDDEIGEALAKQVGHENATGGSTASKIDALVKYALGNTPSKAKNAIAAREALIKDLNERATRNPAEIDEMYASAIPQKTGYSRARIGQLRAEAIALFKAAAARHGVSPERIDAYFGSENNSLAGGADVVTHSGAEVAQSGVAMHTPGEANHQVNATEGALEQAVGDENVVDAETEETTTARGTDGFTDENEQFDVDPADRVVDQSEEGVEDVDAAVAAINDLTTDFEGQAITPEIIAEAEAAWEDADGTKLHESERANWIQAYIANYKGVLNDRQFAEIYAAISTNNQLAQGENRGASDRTEAASGVRVADEGDSGVEVKTKKRRHAARPVESEGSSETSSAEGTDGGVKRSVRSDAVDRLAATVEKWKGVVADYMADRLDPRALVTMFDSTPASMQVLGLPNLPVRGSVSHTLAAIDTHGLSEAQMGRLPGELADPVLVYASKTDKRPWSLNFVTRLKNADGLVIVALHPVQDKPGGKTHYVATVFGRAFVDINNDVRKGGLVYQSTELEPKTKKAFAEAQKKYGRSAIDREALIANGYSQTLPRSGKIVYKSDLVKLIDEGKAQFSNSESAGVTNPTTVAGINKLLKGLFFSGKRFSDKVVIVQSVAGLDPDLRSKHDEKTQAFVKGNKVYMIADNIESGKELAVFLHEVGAHLGMQKLLGPENYAKLVEQIKVWAESDTDTKESRLALKALRRVLSAQENLGEEYGAEEFDDELLAYFVEESVLAGVNPTAVGKAAGPMANWFRTFWAGVKLALRKFGFDRVEQLSAQNIVDIAYGAARLELEGVWHGTAADFRNFDHTYMGSGEGTQAFGWGTYLAQRAGVAKGYWKDDVERKGGGTLRIESKYNSLTGRSVYYVYRGYDKVTHSATREAAEAFVEHSRGPEGALMRVDVNIHDDELLDWDASWGQQSAPVKAALRKANEDTDYKLEAYANSNADDRNRYSGGVASGDDLYKALTKHFGSDKLASEYLDSIGIKGIKFLDRQSRNNSNAQNQTRNLVIFNDKNIVRVATQRGARRDSGSIKYSIAAPQQEFINNVKDAASGFFTNWIGSLKEIGLGSLTLDQMATLVKSAAVRQYTKVMTDIQRFSKERIYRAALLEQPWAKLDKTVQKNLSQAMRDATRAQYDPAKKGEVADTDEKRAVQKKFDALPQQAKEVYTSVRDYYDAMFEERKQILMDAANKADEAAKKAGKKNPGSTREVDAMFAKLKGPYFPLMRIGKWYSVGMSDRVADLMKKRDEGSLTKPETDELAKLRKDENHYIARGHMTRAEAQRSEKELKAQLGNARSNRAEEKIGSEVSQIPDFARIEAYIATDLPSDVRGKVKNMMAQMYFDMLPEHNALKRQMKREGIHGEEEDMRRVFAASAMSMSHQISRLKYANDLSNAMVQVRLDGRDNETRRMVANELKERARIAMDFEETPITDRLLQASYFAHLGVSPAFWFINMTQVPVITLPWLTSRHGLRVSGRALAHAYADTYNLIKSTYKGGDWRSEFDWSSKFKEGSPEDRLFRELLDRNLLDITMEHDLGSVVNMANGKLDNTIKMMNLPVRVTEFANRSVTALAAYRLAMSKPGTTHEQAVNHAIQALNDTQLNYSTLNSPRYMQELAGSKPLARIVFQFRKFQQGMLWLVAKNAYDAVKDESPEVRKEARRMLLGLSATTGLFAGALGLPAAGSLAFIANMIAKAFGDDDEPWDAETELRNWLTDMFGKDAAKVMTKGLPTLAGVDLSKRVGLGDVASPLPFARQGKTGTEKMNNTLVAAAGAPFGTMATLLDGAMELADGNFAKGAEKIIPIKLAQNLIRAGRYGTEGLTDKNGNVIVSEERFSPWDLAMRGAGFQTNTESDYYEGNQAVQNAKHAALDARSKLLRNYAQARLHNEPTQELEASIQEFNQRHHERGIRIDGSAKIKSVQAYRKMARERDDSGIRQDKLSKPFLDEARFVM